MARSSNNGFNAKSFWKLVKRGFRNMGREMVVQALTAYYVANDDRTPAWAKGALYGALAYLVSPLDAIPDALPLVGFTDDATVLVAALAAVGVHATEEMCQRARQQVDTFFG